MNALQDAVNRDADNLYLHMKLADQYAMMRRGSDFIAETKKIKALRARAGAANRARSR
jgi:hypothetical protein